MGLGACKAVEVMNAERVREFMPEPSTLKAFANYSPGLRFGNPGNNAFEYFKTQP
jgi:hypothetical protein